MPGHIAVIGGTGFDQLPPEIFAEPVEVKTRFGAALVLSLSNNYVEPYKLYFLPRHGLTHGLAPHQINYAANIAALEALQVKYVFATNAVGSLRHDLPPGSLVLLDDFIDFTRTRPLTYYSTGEEWQHTDFSTPYDLVLRDVILASARNLNIPVHPTGTYVCCDGPRFESPAEIRMFARWGGDVIGMTGLPETIFAREAGIAYAALTIVTNLGAGLTADPVSHEEVTKQMQVSIHIVRELLLEASGMLMQRLLEMEQKGDEVSP